MLRTKPCALLKPTLLVGLFAITLPVQAQESVYQRFAPIDLTGYWVSVVTEDWHIRMISPARGNFDGLPLTPRAQEAAMAADLEQIERDGLACQAYGAPRLLREPGRLRISWENGNTLRIDTDAGEQTRLLHFEDAPPTGESSLQGYSVAQWEYAGGFDPARAILNPGQSGGRSQGRQPASEPVGGKLYVETEHLAPGMLRKNGVPYSAETEMKEYFNTLTEPDGTEWLIVTTIIHDPINLLVDHITSTNFQRVPDDAGWNPRPCEL